MSEPSVKSRPRLAAADVVATLRAHEAELRAAGIRRMVLFGSVARGEADADSDVDLAVRLDSAARIDLVRLSGLETDIAELLGRKVDLLPEPIEKVRLRANIDRDGKLVF
jgi:predicted nucleotidyltransferase